MRLFPLCAVPLCSLLCPPWLPFAFTPEATQPSFVPEIRPKVRRGYLVRVRASAENENSFRIEQPNWTTKKKLMKCLALQYLIASLLEAQQDGSKVMLLLGEGPAGAVLRAEGHSSLRAADFQYTQDGALRQARSEGSSATSALRRARLAVARRLLETAGASLIFGNGARHGFVLRVPPLSH